MRSIFFSGMVDPRVFYIAHSCRTLYASMFVDPSPRHNRQSHQLSERSRERQKQELLNEIAVPTSRQARWICGDNNCAKDTWTFIEPTDDYFMSYFPEVVQAESERWQNIESWFNNKMGQLGTPSPLSVPPCIYPGVSVKARSFICSLLQRCGIMRLSNIRTCLEQQKVAGLDSVAFLCEAELLGIFGNNVMCIQGACVLRSIGDKHIDPFRRLLLELLDKNDRSINRTALIEKALSLGIMPSNSAYIRCLGDLCVSRGNAWVLKCGHKSAGLQ